jgi:LysR family hca operon transcriptional activator
MELRHLRYFVAVVEEGSLTTAAELRLHTSQPSLSRQIRDLESQVGVELLFRSVHGVELTAAGKAFLDHARLALAQVDAAVEAARRAAQPARKTFAIGFQTGHEMNWLPRAMYVLRDELKSIQVTVRATIRRTSPRRSSAAGSTWLSCASSRRSTWATRWSTTNR